MIILLTINASNTKITTFNNAIGWVRLCNKLVPTKPQNKTKNILPIHNAMKNFLKDIFESPAAIFTKKAGVKGTAIMAVNCSNFTLFIVCITLFNCFLSFVLLSNQFFIILRNKKKDIKHPNTVKIQEIIKPTILPKTRKLMVINTNKGRIGKIDSIRIQKHPRIGP